MNVLLLSPPQIPSVVFEYLNFTPVLDMLYTWTHCSKAYTPVWNTS